MTLEPTERAQLRKFLVRRFNLDELKDLAFDLNVDWDVVSHRTKKQMSRELIAYCERRGHLSRLVAEVLKRRQDDDLAKLFEHLVLKTDQSEDLGITELFANLAYVLGREQRYAAAIECLEAGLTHALSRTLTTEQTENRYKVAEIREALEDAIAHVYPVRSKSLTLEGLSFHKIIQVAASVPLVYLVVTRKGSLAFIILPGCTSLDDTQRNCLDAFTPVGPHPDSETQALVGIGVVWLDDFTSEHIMGDYLSNRGFGTDALRRILDEALETLGEKLIGPLARCLRQLGLEQVTFIPFGQLSVLPLHAARYDGCVRWCRALRRFFAILPVFKPAQTSIPPYKRWEIRYFLDEFQVTYAPSARILSSAHVQVAQLEGERGKLFSAGSEDNAFAQDEAEAVARIAAASPSPPDPIVFEPVVTPPLLLDQVSDAQYIHLACNIMIDVNHPLQSTIGLSGGTTLNLTDLVSVSRLDKADLVTLSAVQPACLDVDQFPKASESLLASFLEAGAARVVGNLWLVNDLSTSLLIQQFYIHYFQHGLAPAAALRRAQRWLREEATAGLAAEVCCQRYDVLRAQAQESPNLTQVSDDLIRYGRFSFDDCPFADPIYWAAFIISGA